MVHFRHLLKAVRVIYINTLVLIAVLFFLEITARSYHSLVNKGGFFRTNKFVSPWITTYDYPPPITKSDGNAYFRHRDSPTPKDKSADTIRIIAVGGSTTVNERPYSVNQIDYQKALEAKLTDGFKEITFEVLNAGGDAYSSAQSLINIEFRLVEFDPDIIILMHNINDSSVNAFRGGATSDYSNKYAQSYYLNPLLQGSLSLTGFLTQSRFLSKIGLPQLLAHKSGDLDADNEFTYGLHLFHRNLASIASICRLHNIDLVLLSQPYSMEPHEYIRKEVFLAYDKAISDVAKEQGVYFIDMFSRFGHEKKNFVDQFHYSTEGIQRFSSILYADLRSIVSRRIENNLFEGDRLHGDRMLFSVHAADHAGERKLGGFRDNVRDLP